MTKREMVLDISGKTGIESKAVKAVVQLILDSIVDVLTEKQRLELRDFGVFEVRHRLARRARNPRTREEVSVPARRHVVFTAGVNVLAKLNKNGDIE